MNNPAFLEIILISEDFTFGGRDAIEDPLDEALQEAQLGEVTGGLRWHLARHRPRVFTQGGLTPEIRTPEIPNPTRLV